MVAQHILSAISTAKKVVTASNNAATKNLSWYAKLKNNLMPDYMKRGEGWIPDSFTGGQPTVAALTGSDATRTDIVRAKKEIKGYDDILVEGGPESKMLNIFKAVTPNVLEPVVFHGLKQDFKPLGLLTGSIFGYDPKKQTKKPWHQYSFNESDTITESDFDPQMLHAYQSTYHLNKNSPINLGTDKDPNMYYNKPGKGVFNYASYNIHAGADNSKSSKPRNPLDKFFRPGWMARYTTGKMNYEGVNDGTIRMTDTFDFNDPPEWLDYSKEKKDSLITSSLSNIGMGRMKDRMRIYANFYGAKGNQGRSVDFNIDPNKNYLYGTEFNTRVPVKDVSGNYTFKPSPASFGSDSGTSMTNVSYKLRSGRYTRGKHYEQTLDYNTSFIMKGAKYIFGHVYDLTSKK